MKRPRSNVLSVLVLALLALVTVVLLLSGAFGTGAGRDVDDDRAAARPAASTATDVPQESVAPTPQATTSAPVRVMVPAIGVDSRLEQLHVDAAGALAAPHDPRRAGWFADGAAPGEVGPAVIAGHVDSTTGPAVFARLADLRPGDAVDVERADGSTARFTVERTEVVDKRHFPTRAVYGPTPDAQLRLISCAGDYVRDAGGYQGNLVVFATEVAS